jgi:pimeloyl-ACP methyl ester carboxylesterase
MVPGTMWQQGGGPGEGPLILIGHGGGGSSREDYVDSLAVGLVRTHGATCIAIDGPVHGRRRGERSQDSGLVLLDFSQVWASDASMTDAMVEDWRHTIDLVTSELDMPDAPLGYWGLSMGTLLGLPLVAGEPRIRACVLGLAGTIGPTSQRLIDDAPLVECPTFFIMQWDDELFPREHCLELFASLGSGDKQLHATPGRHSAVTTETFLMSAAFLANRLGKS